MKPARRLAITENYAFLLAGLLFLFLLIPILHMAVPAYGSVGVLRVCMQSGFSAMMLIGVWSLAHERRIFHVGLGLGLVGVGLAVLGMFHRSLALNVAEALTVFLFCLVSGYIAARHVFGSSQIDRNMLYGAMCVYLLMGLVWALAYDLMFNFWPDSFHGIETVGQGAIFDDFLYFSFVTLASLGYGDITPALPLARTLAYLEVIAGQFYIAIMVAGLVGLYMQGRERR